MDISNNYARYINLINKYGKFECIPEKFKTKEIYLIYANDYKYLNIIPTFIKTKDFYIDFISRNKIDFNEVPEEFMEDKDFLLEIIKRRPSALFDKFPKDKITDNLIRVAMYYDKVKIKEFFNPQYKYYNTKLSYKTWFIASVVYNSYCFNIFIPHKYKNKKMCLHIVRNANQDNLTEMLIYLPKHIFSLKFFFILSKNYNLDDRLKKNISYYYF
jgi:hypothetical protein